MDTLSLDKDVFGDCTGGGGLYGGGTRCGEYTKGFIACTTPGDDIGMPILLCGDVGKPMEFRGSYLGEECCWYDRGCSGTDGAGW